MSFCTLKNVCHALHNLVHLHRNVSASWRSTQPIEVQLRSQVDGVLGSHCLSGFSSGEGASIVTGSQKDPSVSAMP